jgi:hypothetical protein
VNGHDQPVSIVPDIENNKTIHVVRIRKTGPQLLKIPPTRRPYDLDPRANLLNCLSMIP